MPAVSVPEAQRCRDYPERRRKLTGTRTVKVILETDSRRRTPESSYSYTNTEIRLSVHVYASMSVKRFASVFAKKYQWPSDFATEYNCTRHMKRNKAELLCCAEKI